MLVAIGLAVSSQNASAQHRRLGHHLRNHPTQNRYVPNYHVDHNNHTIRDSHGHVIGRYRHDVVHRNSTYIVPHTSRPNHHGTYHVHNNGYYYTPRTAVVGTRRVVLKPVLVQFGSFSNVDDLAGRLESLSNEFLLDLHANYSHNRGFRETYAEAYQLLQAAQFIHAKEHHNDHHGIQRKLNGMDTLFHHVQDDVRGWSRHHHRQVGRLGILSKMDMIESTLHHLMNDVGVQQAPVPGAAVEQAPPPGAR